MEKYTWTRGEYTVTTDIDGIDLARAAAMINEHSWCVAGRPAAMTIESFRHSETFFCLHGKELAGFVRMVTDYVTVAYVTDVNVSPAFQGNGLSKFMFECVMAHPAFAKMRRQLLCTPDASGLYAKFGFVPVSHPDEFMERVTPYDEAYDYYLKTHGLK